jgi:hypothetical protein
MKLSSRKTCDPSHRIDIPTALSSIEPASEPAGSVTIF